MARIFTPEQATRALPLVRRIVSDILPLGRELRALEGRELSDEEMARALEVSRSLEALFAELDQIGCSFRSPDYESGLVDFPAVIDGELVHLCWRDDEAELRYYHDPRSGFAGRRPIPPELLPAPPTSSR